MKQKIILYTGNIFFSLLFGVMLYLLLCKGNGIFIAHWCLNN